MKKKTNGRYYLVSFLALAFSTLFINACNPPDNSSVTYSGRIYAASELGGHIAIYDLSIDPSKDTPISVTNGNGQIKQLSGTPGNSPKHVFHDVRYDDAAKRVYYSTIIPDDALTAGAAATLSTAHVGYIDVSNPSSIPEPVDATIDVDAAAATNVKNLQFPNGTCIVSLPVIYCGTGQTDEYFVIYSMTLPAYIDVIPKSAITSGADLKSARKRFYVEDFRGPWATAGVSLFSHGNISPDQTQIYVDVNEVNVTDATKPAGYPKGAFTGYRLNLSDVLAGTVTPASVITQNTVTGLGGSQSGAPTVVFRARYTADGTKILQSGKDRFFVLDATTLKTLNGAAGDTTIGGGKDMYENHDALSTTDNKYAILTIDYMDSTTGDYHVGGLQLYDLMANKPVGKVAPVCSSCHAATGTLNTATHFLCGIDGIVSKDK
ncbi:MAG: hypothetical protein WCQ99_13285 [Pseudomonadota bacterium]